MQNLRKIAFYERWKYEKKWNTSDIITHGMAPTPKQKEIAKAWMEKKKGQPGWKNSLNHFLGGLW